MKIGFDAKRYFRNQSGLGNYSRDLINSLIHTFPNEQYYLFAPKNIDLKKENYNLIQAQYFELFWRDYFCSNQINDLKLDVFHGLSNQIPFKSINSYTKKIVTIHDVIFKTHPEKYSRIDRTIYNFKTKFAIENSDIIISTSQTTKNEINQYYKLDERKTKVVYQTCNDLFWNQLTEKDLVDFKKTKHLNKPFFLYVSSFNQRKNHIQLIKVFKNAKLKDFDLILIGLAGDTLKEVLNLINTLNLNNNIRVLTDVKTSEIIYYYQLAHGFVYPSINEGFGIPLIEAMASKLPILASDIPVFREIGNNHIDYFELKNDDSLVNGLIRLSEKHKQDYNLHLNLFKKEKISENLMKIYAS